MNEQVTKAFETLSKAFETMSMAADESLPPPATSFKEALLDRMDDILKGALLLCFVSLILASFLVYRAQQSNRCLEALKSSRNGVVIMSLCGQ